MLLYPSSHAQLVPQCFGDALYFTLGSPTLKPISFLGFSGGVINWRMASNTPLNCASYFFSSSSNLFANSLLVARSSRSFTNALIIAMFTKMARSLLRTEESMATPCSVNANGSLRRPPCPFEVAVCDFKPLASSGVSWNSRRRTNVWRAAPF